LYESGYLSERERESWRVHYESGISNCVPCVWRDAREGKEPKERNGWLRIELGGKHQSHSKERRDIARGFGHVSLSPRSTFPPHLREQIRSGVSVFDLGLIYIAFVMYVAAVRGSSRALFCLQDQCRVEETETKKATSRERPANA
jgi:hypothetical protein